MKKLEIGGFLLSACAAAALVGCGPEEQSVSGPLERCEGPFGAEFYDFVQINHRLQSDPALASALGITAVETCDEARAYMEDLYAHIESQPVRDEIELPEEAEALPVVEDGAILAEIDGPDGVTIGTTTRGIKNADATNSNQTGVVDVVHAEGSCTGVVISSRAILTAAHCVAPVIAPARNAWMTMDISRFTPARTQVYFGTVRVNVHPSYAGDGDTGNDVAVVKLLPPNEFTNIPSSFRTRIYTGLGSTIENGLRLYGRGFSSDNRTGSNVLRLMFFEPDWWGPSHFLKHAESARTCEGDSGGPTINWTPSNYRVVAGVHSNSVKWLDNACAMWNGKQRSARLQNKITWIEDMLDVTCHPFSDGGWSYVRCW